MGSKPKTPEAPKPPAARPIRSEVVEPEDIVLGGAEEEETRKRGKRALVKPLGTTGLAI